MCVCVCVCGSYWCEYRCKNMVSQNEQLLLIICMYPYTVHV